MNRVKHVVLCSFLVAITSFPAFEHHSFAAEFDGTKIVTVKGIVAKVEWANPHVYFHVDVKDDKGNVVSWGFEDGNPGQL